MKKPMNIISAAFAPIALAYFTLLPTTQAVNPPPDGGYPGLNTAEGQNALFSVDTSTGLANTAVGWFSLQSDVNGGFNTATGAGTLLFNTADQNTAFGAAALLLNATGEFNTAVGATALLNNTTGSGHTAIGFQALYNNTGDDPDFPNTATGFQALYSNTSGIANTTNGAKALLSNTSGSANTANGAKALFSNTTGDLNTGNGGETLYSNIEGHRNTATGYQSLWSNTTGYRNTATGYSALFNNTTGNFNTANGWAALSADFEEAEPNGNLNTAVGASAGWMLTGDNNIDIGNVGDPADSNTIRIGTVVESTDPFFPNLVHPVHTATYIAGISGQTASGGAAVFVNTDGKLGTLTSSARFKTDIKPMDKTSEAILALKPVTFRYKEEVDTQRIPQFGLVAEDVEKVNPDLVVRDAEGKVYTVRYEAVNAMLLNEFLTEHKKVEQQQAAISQLQSTVAKQEANAARQQKQIDALTAGLQKVSAQLELSQAAPQTVLNNR
jgi:trimeric autotransporter adhesin